ncbi:MAG TPA: hypothetical protein DDW54_02680 [Clostridiales bacterium]|nr:hypothetical protein [Clostridiales bacterium]
MKKRRIIYYKDELNDEFADTQKKETKIGKDFKYIRKSLVWRFFAFIAYRVIMTPIAFIHCKVKFSLKVIGKEKLKPFRKKGVFIYGNHTLQAGDAFIPNVVTFPKKTYVVVKSANLSTRGTKTFITMNGAIPIPTEISAMRNFLGALEKRSVEGSAIMIYPEAHIWPYYTGIRPFKSVSFAYPVKFGDPAFCTTVTYRKRKRRETPKIVVYLDGPFYADKTLPTKEATEKLRNEIYEQMLKRAKSSDYEYIEYRKEGTTDGGRYSQ